MGPILKSHTPNSALCNMPADGHVTRPASWSCLFVCAGTLLLVSLALLPESPRWLVLRGQLDLALATLHKIITSSSKMAGAEPDMQSSESQVRTHGMCW